MTDLTVWGAIRRAGINTQGVIGGIGDDGRVTYLKSVPQARKTQIEQIIATFDPLPELKASMKEHLNEIAEQKRAKLLTLGSAKAMEYQQKYTEAVAILADPSPLPANYPFAAKRAARFSVTLTDVANEWKTKGDLWIAKGAEIIDLVDGAAVAINALTDPATFRADALAIIRAIVWPSL